MVQVHSFPVQWFRDFNAYSFCTLRRGIIERISCKFLWASAASLSGWQRVSIKATFSCFDVLSYLLWRATCREQPGVMLSRSQRECCCQVEAAIKKSPSIATFDHEASWLQLANLGKHQQFDTSLIDEWSEIHVAVLLKGVMPIWSSNPYSNPKQAVAVLPNKVQHATPYWLLLYCTPPYM